MSDARLTITDLHKLKDLIRVNLEACEAGRGKALTLLFGASRSGKTTTFCFLSGRRMVERKIQVPVYQNHVVEQSVFDLYVLPGEESPIGHGFSAKTETMSFSPFDGWILVDTAGLFEPKGPMEEIAHMVALEQILKISTSITPILLLNVEELSGTASFMSMVLKITNTLISSEQMMDNSLLVILTHINSTKDKIIAKMGQLQQSMAEKPLVLDKILGWLLTNSNRVMFLENPVTDDPNRFWTSIKALQPIQGLRQFCLEDNSKIKFLALMEELKTQLLEWIEHRAFEDIISVLETLTFLNEHIPTLVSDTIGYFLQHVANVLQKEYEDIQRQVTLIFTNKRVDERHIIEIRSFRDLVQRSRHFRSLPDVVTQLAALDTFDLWLVQSVKEFADQMPFLVENKDWQSCQRQLDVLRTLSTEISDIGLQKFYSQCKDNIITHLKMKLDENDVSKLQFFLEKFNIQELINICSSLEQVEVYMSNHMIGEFSSEGKLRELKACFARTLQSALDDFTALIDSLNTNPSQNTQLISDMLTASKNISQFEGLHSFFGETCKSTYLTVRDKLNENLEGLLDQLESNTSIHEASLLASHVLTKFEPRADLWKRFVFVTEKTKVLVKSCLKEIKEQLEKWKTLQDGSVTVKVMRSCKKIERWVWIDPITDNFGSKAYEKVKQRLATCITLVEQTLKMSWDRKKFDDVNLPYEVLEKMSKAGLFALAGRQFKTISNKYGGKIIKECNAINNECGREESMGDPAKAEGFLNRLEGFRRLHAFDIAGNVQEVVDNIKDFYRIRCEQKRQLLMSSENLPDAAFVQQQLQALDWMRQCAMKKHLGVLTQCYYQDAVLLVQSQLELLLNTFNEWMAAGDLTRANRTFDHYKLYASFQQHLPDIQLEKQMRFNTLLQGSQNVGQQINQEILSNHWRCAVIQKLLEQLTGNQAMYEKNVNDVIFAFRHSVEQLVDNTIGNLDYNDTARCDQLISQLAIFRRASTHLGAIFLEFNYNLTQARQTVLAKLVNWFTRQLGNAQTLVDRSMFNLATERQLILTHLYERVNNIIELGDECKSKFDDFENSKNTALLEIVNKVRTYLTEGKYHDVSTLWQNTKRTSKNSIDNDMHANDAPSRVKSTILEYFKVKCAQITQISDTHSLSDAKRQLKTLKNDLSFEEELLHVVSPVLEFTGKELVEFSDQRKQNFETLLETKDPSQVLNIKEELHFLSRKDPEQIAFYKHKVQQRVDSIIYNIQQMAAQRNLTFLNEFKLVIEFHNQLGNLDMTTFDQLKSQLRKYQNQCEQTITKCLETSDFQHLPGFFIDYCLLTELVLLLEETPKMILAIRETITKLCATGIKLPSMFRSAQKALDINTLHHVAGHIEKFSATVISLHNHWESRLFKIILRDDQDPLVKIGQNLFHTYLYPQQLRDALEVFINELLNWCIDSLGNGTFEELESLLDGIHKLPLLQPWVTSVVSHKECVIEEIKAFFNAKAREGFAAWRAFPQNLNELSNILRVFVKGEEVIKKLTTNFNVTVDNPLDVIKIDIKREMDELQHTTDLSRAASDMLKLRGLYERIPALESFISTSLRKYTEILSENGKIFSLYTELNRFQSPDDQLLVKYMVAEFPAFKGFLQIFITEKTRQFGIDYVLKEFKKRGPNGTQVSLSNDERYKMKTLYEQFDEIYKQLVHTHVAMPTFPQIIARVKDIEQSRKIRDRLPEVIAHIFALWTLTKSDLRLVAETRNDDYLMKPHPIQVLSIFMLLAADPSSLQPIKNHLIELMTGQGKSIALGVCAIVFVLIGYQVDVVCYSNILSDRDRSDFSDLFESFGVAEKINYGTLEKLSENRVNRNGSVRDLVHNFLSNKPVPEETDSLGSYRVLLIDEVDVFFSPTFLGETYNPLSILVDDRCFTILQYIWENHTSPNFSIQSVMQLDSFVRLVKQYPSMERLFMFQLEQMIADVENFNDPNLPYRINKDTHKIGYKLHDDYNFTISHGHKTTFAYFHAKDTGKITEPELKASVGFYLYCGRFSYAEIPKSYVFVLGVTGTLKSLAPAELNIIQNEYKINEFSYMPSMYGPGLDFKKFSDVEVMPDLDHYFKRIQDLGVHYTKKGHAVLIFFHEAIRIESFQNSAYNMPGWNVLDEATEDKPSAIRRATCAGQCSLSSSVFGRGTDFVCRDQQVIDAGGVVVIQTFWSSVPSEEIQIKGRTARQGAKGLYRVVLLQSDLLSLFPSEQELKAVVHSRELPSTLKKIRKTNYADVVKGLQEKVTAARDVHVISENLRLSLLARKDPQQTWQYLFDVNRTFFVSQNAESFYIILCLDESYSMQGSRWTQLLVAVDAFVADRLNKCKQADRVCTDLLTIVCYNDKARRVIEDTPLELNVSQKLVQQGGQTDFAVAIAESIKKLDEIKLDGKTPVFLFMSDGECSSGDAEMISLHQKYQPHGLQVFVVGFGTDADTSRLKRLANLGHGTYSFGETGDLLKQEFERIATILSCPVLHNSQ